MKMTGLAGLSAIIPFNLPSIEMYPWTKPLWPNYPSAMVSRMHLASFLYEYHLQVGPGIHSVYYRTYRRVLPAPNVSEQDIVNEILSKWNEPDAYITTCAACGHFNNFEPEQHCIKHLSISQLKEIIKRTRDLQLKSIGEKMRYQLGKGRGERIHTLRRDNDGKHLISTNEFPQKGAIYTHRIRLYDEVSFAKEMITERNYNEKHGRNKS